MLNSKSIGSKIATARKKLNLSQAELAQQVSISPQAVGKWERGESLPDITTLNRLAGLLQVDLNYFSDNFQSITTDKQEPLADHSTNQPNSTSLHNPKLDWNWDMSKGNWMDGDFSGLKNLKEKFSSSNIKNCKFNHAELTELLLEKNNIEGCDFSSADLRDSKIQFSNLLTNQFNACSFIDAIFVKNNIEKCNFTEANFSGAEFLESNVESIDLTNATWHFTKFFKSNLSRITFSGTIENCHFEHCKWYHVKFENATILNSFFKYNDRFKKVQFVNCTVDKLTLAFLKNNDANLDGITVID